jgi:hypothetical protein
VADAMPPVGIQVTPGAVSTDFVWSIHVSKKTKAFVAGLRGRLHLFYLPPYSPERNPDGLVWQHLKADTVGRPMITSFNDFVKSSVISLQPSPSKIRSFFQKPSLKYAA